MAEITQGIAVALDARLTQRLKEWIKREGKSYGPEVAAALLLDEVLAQRENGAPHLSDGEKLLMQMLGEVHSALDAVGGEERDRIMTALKGGHLWSLGDVRAMAAPARRHTDVQEVRSTLTMFRAISNTLGGVTSGEVEKLGSLIHGPQIKFAGYNSDSEAAFLAIAKFVIHEQQLFAEQAGVTLSSRRPMRTIYRPMLAIWEVIARDRAPGRLSIEHLADLLRAGADPS